MEERRSKERVQDLEIYTDGSLKKMGQTMTFGGWAFLAVRDSVCIYGASGDVVNTTNQRMELTALVEALKYAESVRRPHERITVYSDSAYIINCYLQDWYLGWVHNGWLNSQKKPVANQDLWEQIIPFFDSFWYSFKKVHAHSGEFWNEQCDTKAQDAAERGKKNWKGNTYDR